jgi:ABC-type transporter MlaC component
MQRAEDSSSRLLSESEPPRAGLRPSLVFAAISVALVAIAATFLLTRPDTSPPPSTTQTNTEPNFSLTNEEAITRFEELDNLRHQAFREVDVSLLSSIYLPGSKVLQIASKELGRLQRDGVQDLSAFTTLQVDVIANTSNYIRLRQAVEVRPKFVAADGTDITSSAKVVRRVVEWTLSEAQGQWLVADSLIVGARVVRP